MRSGIEGVAFDLDGTLYPNYRLNVKLIPFILREGRLLAAFGKARSIIRKEQEKSPIPQGGFYERQAEIVAKILDVPPQPLKEKIDLLIYSGWYPLFKNIKLFNRAAQTLAGLKEAGYKLGLLSDFPPEKKLEYLKIDGFWDAVLCSEYYGTLKPHPLSFTELAAAMSLPPEKILYVGNSHPYDVAGANRAGMKTALIKSVFSPGRRKSPKPDFTFSDYRQLYDFMLN
jgi:putative hydrolase of the HAD superfamily